MSDPAWLDPVCERQSLVWALALLAYGLGDSVTTVLGLRDATTAEAGPLAARAIEAAGVGGLLALKLALFAAAYGAWRLLRTPGRAAVPLALAVAGTLVTAWNVAVLLS